MTPELHRPFATERIGVGGTPVELEASPAELVALAARMGLPGIEALRCRFVLRRLAAGIVAAEGELAAQVVQVCVVTLDEFTSGLNERFTVHFVPVGGEEDDPDPDAVDQVPYADGAIDLGEAAAEQLALALDPYPHRPGASLADEPAAAPAHPFAGLAKLRQ